MASVRTNRLDPDELAAWRGMLRAHRDLVHRLDEELHAQHGISLSTYEVLMILSDSSDGRLRLGELASETVISRSGLTRLVDRLEREGLAIRELCDDDRRGYFATITDRGRELCELARPSHLDGVRRLFLATLRPGELETLGAIWERTPPPTGAQAASGAGSPKRNP